MNADELRAALSWLGLSQAEAARLLGVKLRTVQRWLVGSPPVAEPAAQALSAWRRLAERGIAWRPDGAPAEAEDLAVIAQLRRQALGLPEMQRRRAALATGRRRRWRVNIERCRVTSPVIVLHFNRMADGSFLPASYRRLDRPADHRQDRPLLDEAILAFFDAVSKARSAEMLRRVDRVRRQESAPGPEALVP